MTRLHLGADMLSPSYLPVSRNNLDPDQTTASWPGPDRQTPIDIASLFVCT
jgi:hypothetical protein